MSQSTIFPQALNQSKTVTTPGSLQPMPFRLSVALVGIPALVTIASVYLFMPWLKSLGISEFKSFLTAHLVPMALLFAAALVALYRVEKYPLTWASLSERFRYPRLRFKDVLWALGIYVAMTIGYGIMSQVGAALVKTGLIPIPAGLPGLMDPRVALTIPMLDQMAGGSMRGNWEIAVLYFVMLFFNIAGEELWWRGYLLPRQELTHGRWTWLVHGLMWTIFHAFKWWDMIGLLPVCLIISYSAQRLKNNWPAFIAHYLFNGAALVIVLGAVLGVL